MKNLLLSAVLATWVVSADTPRIINATPWVMQSLNLLYQVQQQVCRKLSISSKKCDELLSQEVKSVREFVDKVCEKEEEPKQEACINEWMEWVLDNKLIPYKIYILNTPSQNI